MITSKVIQISGLFLRRNPVRNNTQIHLLECYYGSLYGDLGFIRTALDRIQKVPVKLYGFKRQLKQLFYRKIAVSIVIKCKSETCLMQRRHIYPQNMRSKIYGTFSHLKVDKVCRKTVFSQYLIHNIRQIIVHIEHG